MEQCFALLNSTGRAALVAALLGCATPLLTGCRDAAGPTTGAVRIVVTTTGLDLDADGYTVTVDGAARRAVAPVDAVMIRELATGGHTVTLRGIADNCTVSEDHPRTVTVIAGDTAAVAFTVGCAPVFGSLRVITTATGADLDPDGFAVVLDGGPERPVPVGDTALISPVPVGGHTVELQGMAANCVVDGAPLQAASLAPGSPGDTTRPTVEVAFAVACTALVGSVRVTTATTGVDLPNGYGVSVDDGPSHPLGVSGVVTISDVRIGEHLLRLENSAANCAVGGANPRAVIVAFRGTAELAFTVTCTALSGSVLVSTATTGADIDPDGYTVNLDGGSVLAVDVNGSVSFSGIAVGEHAVELAGLAANCAVSGDNPRPVTVPAGAPAEFSFAVSCTARAGSLRVTTATTGADLDSDGYTVSADGGTGQAVSVNGVIVIEGLKAGVHLVALGGVASNCAVGGDNPRTASVAADATAEVAFAISCVPRTGSLRVTTATTGADSDPDGYVVSVDGGPGQAVGVNDAIRIDGILATTHTIALGGVASNCGVTGANPRTVSVTPGGTAEVAFAVACAEAGGWLRVSTSTTGSELDPDGYSVWVDRDCNAYEAPCAANATIGVNGAVTISVGAGGHAVELDGLAANCAVSGPNPQTATVSSGDTTDVRFAVTCVATGSVRVTTTTTGAELDPDGYTVNVDGAPGQAVGVNDAVVIGGVLPGGHTIALTGLASNCTVSGGSSRGVVVTAGEAATVSFEVTCAAPGDLLAFDYQWCVDNGFFSGCGADIVVATAVGSNRTGVAGPGLEPAWSPDGGKIAYSALDPFDAATPSEIAVVNLGAGTVLNLTNHPAQDYSPAWSPDGSGIAFVSDREGRAELYVMSADGSGVTRITGNVGFVGAPTWSPDGHMIVFDCEVESGNRDLCAVSPDGTGFVRLTHDGAADFGAAWSPDGARIAFSTRRYDAQAEIAVMNADGSGVMRVRAGTRGSQPTWSPDGTRIAFADGERGRACDNSCVYSGFLGVMSADGSGLVWIGDGSNPAWRPRSPAQP